MRIKLLDYYWEKYNKLSWDIIDKILKSKTKAVIFSYCEMNVIYNKKCIKYLKLIKMISRKYYWEKMKKLIKDGVEVIGYRRYGLDWGRDLGTIAVIRLSLDKKVITLEKIIEVGTKIE